LRNKGTRGETKSKETKWYIKFDETGEKEQTKTHGCIKTIIDATASQWSCVLSSGKPVEDVLLFKLGVNI
jgi:hypothetical protein